MPIGSVAAYQAALETTTTNFSYAMESTWATAPATTFQSARLLSETLADKKTRTRPPEVRGDRQSAAALTTQEAASGTLVAPVFFGQQTDDFLSAALGNDWQVPTVINGVGGDISLTSGGALTSPTTGKFAGILVSQILKLNGFTNVINNGFYRVAAVISGTSLTLMPLGFVPVTETPSGTTAKITYSNLRNGPYFKSIFGQQRLDPNGTKWFRYPGMYPTKASLSLSLGQFAQLSVDTAVQQELKGLVDVSTGGIIPAPSLRSMDPVAGFKGVFFNDAPLASGINSCGFDFTNDGAAAEFFLGSPIAQGMLQGTFMSAGKCSTAFRDFTLYDSFRSETLGVFTACYGDQLGNRYFVTQPSSTLLFNSGVPMSGPNKMLMADVDVEAGPDAASGCTVSIDRFSYLA